ncbi:MAG: hypothetical protein V3W35_05285 [Gemmatimonadota bacterium]
MRIFRLNRVGLLSLGLVAPWLGGCASSGAGLWVLELKEPE